MKELRLRGISSIQAGNAFLPEFAADYDARFARPPANSHDAHRPLRPDDDLEEIFRWKEQRRLTGNLTIDYRRSLYLVEDSLVARAAAGKLVDVHEREDGTVIIRHGDDELEATAMRKAGHVSQQDVESNKYLASILESVRHEQLARDEETLRSSKPTLRQKHRLRLDMLRRVGASATRAATGPAVRGAR